MKRIVAFLLLFFPIEMLGQYVFPLLTNQPQWHVLHCGMGIFGVSCQTNIYSYSNSVLMCGNTYDKVTGRDIYVRISGQKVHMRATTNCSDKEYLMYDFAANPGDSMYCGYQIYMVGIGTDTSLFKVEAIDTIMYNGIARERFKMSYNNPDFPLSGVDTMYWIKGIGSLINPFYPNSCINAGFCDIWDDLTCYDSSFVELFHDTLFASCDTTIYADITDDAVATKIFAFPNPADDILTIRNNTNELSQLTIYDITTRKILQQTFTNTTTLNTSNFSKGIYFYEVRNKEGVIKKGKIIKE